MSSKALPSAAYGDPSKFCDQLRTIERKMQGCEKCKHGDRVFGVKVCLVGARPDADGYCGRWANKK